MFEWVLNVLMNEMCISEHLPRIFLRVKIMKFIERHRKFLVLLILESITFKKKWKLDGLKNW